MNENNDLLRMDSKYTSVGVGNSLKSNGFKRKHAVENIKVKKIKLSNDNVTKTNNIKVESNGHENAAENKIVKETVQDLQEARKQLPVYMVRNRYVISPQFIIHKKYLCCDYY